MLFLHKVLNDFLHNGSVELFKLATEGSLLANGCISLPCGDVNHSSFEVLPWYVPQVDHNLIAGRNGKIPM